MGIILNRSATEPEQLQEARPQLPGTEARFHRFRVGDIDCISLSDGSILIPLGPPPLPAASHAEQVPFQTAKPSEFRLIPLSCLLVTVPKTGKVVLIDSGFGYDAALLSHPMRSDGRLVESLDAAGVPLDSIDFVLVSHFDPDHVGGLLRENGSRMFPNAAYYAGAEEVAFWSKETIDLSYSPAPERVKQERLSVSGKLLRFAGHALKTFRAGEEVIPGIGSIALPGHTPGQVGFIIDGEPESLFYTADAVANSVVAIETPHVYNPMDLDPETGVKTRHELIKLLLEKKWQSFSPHFPWPSVGRVERAGDGAVWKSA